MAKTFSMGNTIETRPKKTRQGWMPAGPRRSGRGLRGGCPAARCRPLGTDCDLISRPGPRRVDAGRRARPYTL